MPPNSYSANSCILLIRSIDVVVVQICPGIYVKSSCTYVIRDKVLQKKRKIQLLFARPHADGESDEVFCRPQKISGASRQSGVPAFS